MVELRTRRRPSLFAPVGPQPMNDHLQVLEHLYQSEDAVIDRIAIGGREVIRRRPLVSASSVEDQYRRAVAASRALQTTGVTGRHELLIEGGEMALLVDSDGGRLLSDLLDDDLELGQRLRLAIGVVAAIYELHTRRLVHGGLVAEQLLVGSDDYQVQILELESIRSSDPTIELDGRPAGAGEDSLADPQEDLVALGRLLAVIFRRELTVRPEPALAQTVERLLGRGLPYRAVSSVEHDLRLLRRSYETTGTLDLSTDQLLGFGADLPLAGRRREKQALAAALEDWSANQLVLLTGEAGVGKTALLDWLVARVGAAGHLVARAGFHRTGSTPFAEISILCDQLVLDRLGAPPQEFEAWMEEVRSRQDLAWPLLTLAPALEAHLDPPEEMPAGDDQGRALIVALRFLLSSAVGTGRRVMLVLDDVQWADDDSMAVFAPALDPQPGVVVVLAARVGGGVGDPDEVVQRRLRDAYRLELEPLDAGGVGEMVASALRIEGLAESTAAVVHGLTAGYPLHVLQLVQRALDQEILVYEVLAKRWQWDQDALAGLDVAPHVAALIARSVGDMAQSSARILGAAAQAGRPFTIDTAAAAAATPVEQAAEAIWAGIERRIIRRGDGPRAAMSYLSLETSYEFVHDRVAQSASDLLDDDERRLCHLRLGLHHHRNDEPIGAGLQLLDGALAAVAPATQAEVANALLTAGQLARRSASHGMALSFFQAGLELVERMVNVDETQVFDLHLGAAEAAFCLADYDTMNRELDLVEASATAPSLMTRVAAYRCRALYSSQEVAAAVDVGLDALARLGHGMPASPTRLRLLGAVAGTRFRLRRLGDEEILALPRCQDEEVEELQQLLHELFTSLYGVRPDLAPLVAAKGIELTLRSGLSAFSPVALSLYGMVFSYLGNHDQAGRYGRLALILSEQERFRRTRPRVTFIYQTFIQPWQEPLASGIDPLREAFNASLDSGDIDFAGILGVVDGYHMIAAGHRLPDVATRCEEVLASVPANRNAASLCRLVHQFVHNLMGLAPRPLVLAGNGDYDETAERRRADEEGDRVAVSSLLLCRLGLLFWAGDYRGVVDCAGEVEPYFDSAQATTNGPNSQMMHLFAACQVDPRSRSTRRLATKVLGNFRTWAQIAPDNWATHHHLLLGAWARARGRLVESEVAFESALKAGQAAGLAHLVALIKEQLGELCLETGRESIGEHYLTEAHDAYLELGYRLRVDHLERRYGASTSAARPRPAPRPPGIRATVEAVTRAADGRQLVGEFLDGLQAATSADSVILLLGTDGELHTHGAKHGSDPASYLADGQGGSAGIGAAVQIVERTMEPLLVGDLRTTVLVSDPQARARSVRSLLAVPILARGRVIGQLHIEHHRLVGAFSEADLATAEIMAAQLALGLENLELAGELQRLTQREATLADASRRFVPDEVLGLMGHERLESVRLGDSIVRETTVMFSDIRSFTSIAEQKQPAEVSQLENDFFKTLEPAIVANRGVIQSFRGDQILAIFDRSPADAVAAGLAMIEARRRWQGDAVVPVTAGLGINTGLVSFATVGGVQRLSTVVSGDAVNLASRIEGLTKRYGADLLIGETTFQTLNDTLRDDVRRVERVRVVNRSTPVTVYEVFAADRPEVRRSKRLLAPLAARAFGAFDGGDLSAASQLFEQWQRLVPDDPIPRLHLERLAAAGSDPWEPVIDLDEK